MSQPPLDALLAEGSLAGQAGDFEHAIACFRAAMKQAPRHAGIMLYLSKALGLAFQYPEAERWLESALRISPPNEKVFLLAVQNWQEWDRPQGALTLLKRAAAKHSSAQVWLQLGSALERANQLTAAEDAAARAADLAPEYPGVLHLRGRLARRSDDFATAELLFQKALAQKPAPEEEAEIWYSCASLWDKLQRFEEAWNAASRAKALQRELAERLREPPDAWREDIRRLDALATAVSAAKLDESDSALVVLCGYPRSGTTLLGQILAAHPQVTYADEVLAIARVLRLGENLTEPATADWMLHANQIQREKLRREYRRCLEAHLGKRLDWTRPCIIDKNPAVSRFVPALFALFPGMKVVFPRRDPRDLAISCYLRPFPVNPFTAHFNRVETIASHIQANDAVWKASCARLPLAHLEVRYEDLVASRTNSSQRVCNFLGLDPARLPADHTSSAASRFIHSPTYAEVLQPIHQRAVGRWQAYRKWLGPSLDTLHQLAAEQGYPT